MKTTYRKMYKNPQIALLRVKTMDLKTIDKASVINNDPDTFGSFAEIGAGQETARWFFKAKGSSNTIAKTISAYDTTFSDEIYGKEKSGRYVCESRLIKMLDHEYKLMHSRLNIKRGKNTRFFAFANTLATKNNRSDRGHGWLGIRFQHEIGKEPSEVVIHINLNDPYTNIQKEVTGLIGINLIHAALYLHKDPKKILESLADNISQNNIEIDMIRCSGDAFGSVDNRLLCLELVKMGLSKVILFRTKKNICQPSDILYKKNVLIQRGDFRPVTNAQLKIQDNTTVQIKKDHKLEEKDIVVIMELSFTDLQESLDTEDFLARANILNGLGYNVMISNYPTISDLGERMRLEKVKRYTFILSERRLANIFEDIGEDKLMQDMGKFLSDNGYIYIYNAGVKFNPNKQQKKLFDYLVSEKRINIIKDQYKPEHYNVASKIKSNDTSWTKYVPSLAVKAIQENNYFKN